MRSGVGLMRWLRPYQWIEAKNLSKGPRTVARFRRTRCNVVSYPVVSDETQRVIESIVESP